MRDKLTAAVRGIVAAKGPIKATAIETLLPIDLRSKVDKSDINSVLYNELRDECVKDGATNAWGPAVNAPGHSGGQASSSGRRVSDARPTPIVPTQDQRKIIDFELDGHLLVRGEAGSGKTTVLAARAQRIKALFGQGSLLFLTYNGSLAAYVRTMLEQQGLESGVEVCTFHQWAGAFARHHGFAIKEWVTQREREERLLPIVKGQRTLLGQHRLFQQDAAWWSGEIAWIFGQAVTTVAAYSEVTRTGRGRSVVVRRDDRRYVWAVFESYRNSLLAGNLWDMDDPLQ